MHPAYAEDSLDSLASRLDPGLLEAVRRAELSFLLRHRQRTDRDRPVEREPPDSFMASGIAAGVSIAIRC